MIDPDSDPIGLGPNLRGVGIELPEIFRDGLGNEREPEHVTEHTPKQRDLEAALEAAKAAAKEESKPKEESSEEKKKEEEKVDPDAPAEGGGGKGGGADIPTIGEVAKILQPPPVVPVWPPASRPSQPILGQVGTIVPGQISPERDSSRNSNPFAPTSLGLSDTARASAPARFGLNTRVAAGPVAQRTASTSPVVVPPQVPASHATRSAAMPGAPSPRALSSADLSPPSFKQPAVPPMSMGAASMAGGGAPENVPRSARGILKPVQPQHHARSSKGMTSSRARAAMSAPLVSPSTFARADVGVVPHGSITASVETTVESVGTSRTPLQAPQFREPERSVPSGFGAISRSLARRITGQQVAATPVGFGAASTAGRTVDTPIAGPEMGSAMIGGLPDTPPFGFVSLRGASPNHVQQQLQAQTPSQAGQISPPKHRLQLSPTIPLGGVAPVAPPEASLGAGRATLPGSTQPISPSPGGAVGGQIPKFFAPPSAKLSTTVPGAGGGTAARGRGGQNKDIALLISHMEANSQLGSDLEIARLQNRQILDERRGATTPEERFELDEALLDSTDYINDLKARLRGYDEAFDESNPDSLAAGMHKGALEQAIRQYEQQKEREKKQENSPSGRARSVRTQQSQWRRDDRQDAKKKRKDPAGYEAWKKQEDKRRAARDRKLITGLQSKQKRNKAANDDIVHLTNRLNQEDNLSDSAREALLERLEAAQQLERESRLTPEEQAALEEGLRRHPQFKDPPPEAESDESKKAPAPDPEPEPAKEPKVPAGPDGTPPTQVPELTDQNPCAPCKQRAPSDCTEANGKKWVCTPKPKPKKPPETSTEKKKTVAPTPVSPDSGGGRGSGPNIIAPGDVDPSSRRLEPTQFPPFLLFSEDPSAEADDEKPQVNLPEDPEEAENFKIRGPEDTGSFPLELVPPEAIPPGLYPPGAGVHPDYPEEGIEPPLSVVPFGLPEGWIWIPPWDWWKKPNKSKRDPYARKPKPKKPEAVAPDSKSRSREGDEDEEQVSGPYAKIWNDGWKFTYEHGFEAFVREMEWVRQNAPEWYDTFMAGYRLGNDFGVGPVESIRRWRAHLERIRERYGADEFRRMIVSERQKWIYDFDKNRRNLGGDLERLYAEMGKRAAFEAIFLVFPWGRFFRVVGKLGQAVGRGVPRIVVRGVAAAGRGIGQLARSGGRLARTSLYRFGRLLGRAVPIGVSRAAFKKFSRLARAKLGGISDEIMVQGSRVTGRSFKTGKRVLPDADIDIAILVSPTEFNRLLKQAFKTPNPGSNKQKVMFDAIAKGKLRLSKILGKAEARQLREAAMEILGVPKADISIIAKFGRFDRGPYIPLMR